MYLPLPDVINKLDARAVLDFTYRLLYVCSVVVYFISIDFHMLSQLHEFIVNLADKEVLFIVCSGALSTQMYFIYIPGGDFDMRQLGGAPRGPPPQGNDQDMRLPPPGMGGPPPPHDGYGGPHHDFDNR